MTASTTTTTVTELPAATTEFISGDGATYNRDVDPFSIQVGTFIGESSTIESYAAYEWDFSSDEIDGTFTVSDVTGASIILYHSQAESPIPIGEIEVVSIASGITALTNSALWAAINGSTTVIDTVTISGDQKGKTTIVFDSAAALTTLETAITGAGAFAVGIRRSTTTTNGQALFGGMTLARDIETAWAATDATNIADPPRLYITSTRAVDNHPLHYLKYTSAADPSVTQSTPSASLGGYAAPNVVSTRAQLDENISSTQVTVPILTGDSLPSSSTGLVSVGSEIMRYGGLDSTNNQLINVTRAVVPPFAYPAITEPFPEFVHYLSTDGLFDTKPTSAMVQYRCVAIQQQSDTDASWQTTFPQVILTQNPNADVQVDIGIEVPTFDVHYGTFQVGVTGGNEFTSNDADAGTTLGVIEYPDGFFNGGHIIIDPDGSGLGPLNHIIDSYEYDSGTGLATFFLEDDLPASEVVAGTEYRINPAPSQVVLNEVTAPNQNTGLFTGFFGDGGTSTVTLQEHNTSMLNFDVFYLWIKRTLTRNKKSGSDTGAIITILSERIQ